MSKKTNPPPKVKKQLVHNERRAMMIRRIRRTAVMALIWLTVIVYAVVYIVLIYQKDLRLVAPNVSAQLHEEQLLSPQAADRIVALFSGRFSPHAQPPATELTSDNQNFTEVIQILNNRADLWCNIMIVAMSVSILSTAIMHMLWRMRCRRIISPSREVPVIRSHFHDLLTICIVINCLLAAAMHRIGYEGQTNVTLQQLAYNGVFLLSPIVLTLSTRLTAPICISGTNCYFR